jgi:hypothetical protein
VSYLIMHQAIWVVQLLLAHVAMLYWMVARKCIFLTTHAVCWYHQSSPRTPLTTMGRQS